MLLFVTHSCVYGAMVRMVGGQYYCGSGNGWADNDDDGGMTWPSMSRFSVDKVATCGGRGVCPLIPVHAKRWCALFVESGNRDQTARAWQPRSRIQMAPRSNVDKTIHAGTKPARPPTSQAHHHKSNQYVQQHNVGSSVWYQSPLFWVYTSN